MSAEDDAAAEETGETGETASGAEDASLVSWPLVLDLLTPNKQVFKVFPAKSYDLLLMFHAVAAVVVAVAVAVGVVVVAVLLLLFSSSSSFDCCS